MTQQPTVVVLGKVRSREGEPVPDARVFITEGPTSFSDIALLTDDFGRFALSVPSAGTYTLMAVAEGFPPTSVVVQATLNTKPVEIELARLD
jgi:hypothetical protein